MDRFNISWPDLVDADSDGVLCLLAGVERCGDSEHDRDWTERMAKSAKEEDHDVRYAIGPVEQDAEPGYSNGPYRSLDDAYAQTANRGDGLFRIQKDGADTLVDVWHSESRRADGVVFPSGWAFKAARDHIKTEIKSETLRPATENQGRYRSQLLDEIERTNREYVAANPQPVSHVVRRNIVVPPRVRSKLGEADMAKLPRRNFGAEPSVGASTGSEQTSAEPVGGESVGRKTVDSTVTVRDGDSPDVESATAQMSRVGRRSVFICIGRTYNVGNFESVRVDVGRTEIVPDDGEPGPVARDVYDRLKQTLAGIGGDIKAMVEAGEI